MRASDDEILRVTGQVVSAFLSGNKLALSEITDLMRSIHAAVVDLAGREAAPESEHSPIPAVEIGTAIEPNFVTCLDCGKKLKSLKFHLQKHGLTPETYRARWRLPANYPLVAPNFTKMRSALAVQSRFGTNPRSRARK